MDASISFDASGQTKAYLSRMPKKHSPLGERIKLVRELTGLTQERFAEAVGVERGAVGNWELGGGIKRETLVNISEKFGISMEWLSTGRGRAPARSAPEPDFDATERPADGIKEIDVRAGMGGGGTTEGREVIHQGNYSDPVKSEAWHFPSRFMREEIKRPESRVIVIETRGDSMTPTILSGDRVIIDTDHKIPSPDGIYAIRDGFGAIVVKRLQLLRRGDPPIIRIISDNKSHDPEDVGADQIAIVGRVLWAIKRL